MAINPEDNIGRVNVKLSEDQDRTSIPYLMSAIVVEGEIVGYLPIKASDNGDGTASLDLSATLSVSDIQIGAVEIKNKDTDDRVVVDTLGRMSVLPFIGVAEHHNGTAIVTPATVNFSGTSKSILIENRDSTNNLLISFDSGANTKTIAPGQSMSIDANHALVDVSASAGIVAYEMLVTV